MSQETTAPSEPFNPFKQPVIFDPKPIKAGSAVIEKLQAQIAAARERIPQLRKEADDAMQDVDPADRKAITEIVATRTQAEVLEKRIPLLEQKVEAAAVELRDAIKAQREEYNKRRTAEASATETAIVNTIRRWAPVFIRHPNEEREDTALLAAHRLPIMRYFRDQWPAYEDPAHPGPSIAPRVLEQARSVLELYAEWVERGKRFAPLAMPSIIKRGAGAKLRPRNRRTCPMKASARTPSQTIRENPQPRHTRAAAGDSPRFSILSLSARRLEHRRPTGSAACASCSRARGSGGIPLRWLEESPARRACIVRAPGRGFTAPPRSPRT